MQGKSTATYGGKYVIALYIRLSQEDRDVSLRADKAESNSITNQRELLWDFIRNHEEFADCTVIEKCDDGYSGVHFESRPAFTELIELAKSGKVNCIIVKDFSRFGRNYVELGDYLEQYFPFLGVRFISVNDNYDSKEFEGTTGGLDVAFKNMIYDFYSREFSKKQRIAWKRMAEKGEYNAPNAMYGYRKADDNVHQLIVHEETGQIVREIFELVASGLSPLKVAKILNERGVLPPSEFQNMQGFTKQWSRYGAKCYWTDDRIRCMIKDERYTGTMISLKTTSFTVRGKRVKTPPSEWVRVEDTHEPIVSYELYVKANATLKQMDFRLSGKSGKNIYHCGYCGRKMQKDSKGGLRCNQRYLVKECMCRKAVICIEETDKAVLASLKQQIALLIRETELSKIAKNKAIPYSNGAEIATLIKTIATMKKTWMPLYERYTDGKLSREDFLVEKKKYDEETAKLEQRLQELQSKEELHQDNDQQSERNISQLRCYAEQLELTEEIKEKLIDKVNVYSDNRIEICWNFESGFFDLETMHKCG